MNDSPRVQLWSCGRGRQSAGIAALIVQGRLPPPDWVCMVASRMSSYRTSSIDIATPAFQISRKAV